MEVWKDIQGYNGFYQVSNIGRVKSVRYGGRILKEEISNTGYKRVTLCIKRIAKSPMVHRLVGQAFIINPLNKPEINHIDGNRFNNNADNLEWATRTENNHHALITGLRKTASGEWLNKKLK